MSVLDLRYGSNRLPFNGGLVLEITTALLIVFAAVLVLVRLSAAVGVAPATDLEFLAIAYS